MSYKLTIKAANKAPRVIEATNGGSVSLVGADSNVVIHAASSLAAFTLALPPATGLAPGKETRIGFAAAVAALTLQAGSGNIVLASPPSSVSTNSTLRFVLDASKRWCIV